MSRGRADAALGNLDRDSWKRVEALLDRAMELSGAARAGFLDAACAGDEGLRRVLDTLLAADSTSGSLLDRPLPEQGLAALLDPGTAEPIPERIGPWRVLREIGRGGMGVVCLAERADGQFRQRAAIKLVKRGLDTDEILSRFRRERQILAQLEHPHIARLLDGGATPDGRPYLVMEHVDGVPLTEHCRSRALTLEETLALFDQACEAVQYAHRNLVVHRDLKPSHVVVSAGAVKLLDFGIAKVLAPEEDDPEAPETRAPRLTPDYAAPEQIRGEPATTATDVYALGVVLYELLAGSRPPRPGASPEPAPEPEPASAAAARNARAPRAPGGSSPAGTAPIGDWWRRRGRGDLDDIVAMAIRREPERRYPSVEALREDLARFRAGRPVRATRSTWRYRSAKWIARNRVAVTAGALVVLSLVAGLVGTAWQARRASRERDRALVEVRKARELKDFALGLFEVSDPAQSRGASITARDLLERGTARVERELRDQPAVRAEMLDLIAGVYFQLGAYDRAESLETRALDLRRRAAGPRSAEVAASLNRLGQICTEKAQYARATTYLRQALALRVARAARNDAEVAETLSNLASALRRSGQLDSAEALFRRALVVDEAAFGPRSAETAADLDNLGVIMIDRQRYPEAVSLQGRALEIRRRALGEDHPMTATTAENLALALQGAGRTREAIALHEEALRIRRRVLDPGHIDLAQTLGNYANLKRDLGDYAGAAAMYAEALEIERRTFGPDHPDVARDMNNLAILEYQLGRAEAARRHFEEAHAFLVRTKGPDYPGSLTMEQNVAIVLRGMGRYAEAERGLRRVLARRRAVEGPEHPDLAGAEHHLGILLHLEGRSAEGETLLRRALARREKALGDSAAGVGQTLEALAGVLRDRGRYAESLPLYRRAVAIDARVFPAISPQTAEAFVGLGRLLLLMGRPREAEPYLRDALTLRARAYGGDNPKTAEAAVALGLCGRAAHEPGPSADSLIASGLPVLRRQPGRPDPLVALAGRPEPAGDR